MYVEDGADRGARVRLDEEALGCGVREHAIAGGFEEPAE